MTDKFYEFILPDKVYDFLVFMASAFLPAFGTLYAALAVIWGFPYGEAVASTCVALIAFCEVFIKASRKNYLRPADVDVSGLEYLEDGDDDELA